jgi:ATP-dependent Lon protease
LPAPEKIVSAEVLSALKGGIDPGVGAGTQTVPSPPAQNQLPPIPDTLSILPVRGFVVFPGAVVPLNVHRPASVKLLDETLPQSKIIGLIAQRDPDKEEPAAQDLYGVGTAAIILKLLRQSDNHVVALAQGLRRFELRKLVQTDPYFRGEIALLNSVTPPATNEFEAAFRNLRDSAARLFELTPDAPQEIASLVRSIENAEQLTDFLAVNLDIDVAQKQALLE